MMTERKDRGEITLLLLKGSFEATRDLDQFTNTMEALLDAGRTRVVLDMHLLSYLNSTAVGRLVKYKKRLSETGGDLHLLAPTRAVREVLDLLHLDQLFRTFGKEGDALAALGGSAAPAAAGGTIAAGGPAATPAPDSSIRTSALAGVNIEEQGAVLLFKLLDPHRAQLFGKLQGIGSILEVDKERLTFLWVPPGQGKTKKKTRELAEPELAVIFAPGAKLKLKFRLPLHKKAFYYEVPASVESSSAVAGGLGGAKVTCGYAGLAEAERRDIVEFMKALTYLHRERAKTAAADATAPGGAASAAPEAAPPTPPPPPAQGSSLEPKPGSAT
ncbi:MAG: STAS domain-containing protein [Planctomycetes bacterium]|nr:STAS domain-containing protein [Planctomycetota bacterium]